MFDASPFVSPFLVSADGLIGDAATAAATFREFAITQCGIIVTMLPEGPDRSSALTAVCTAHNTLVGRLQIAAKFPQSQSASPDSQPMGSGAPQPTSPAGVDPVPPVAAVPGADPFAA